MTVAKRPPLTKEAKRALYQVEIMGTESIIDKIRNKINE
jgi:hypothetical protein